MSTRPLSSSPSLCQNEGSSPTIITGPLGLAEKYFVQARGPHGFWDCFLTLWLNCADDEPIEDSDVVYAWATLRLRHPLLAARVGTDGSSGEPTFFYSVPSSHAHALDEASAEIEIATCVDLEGSMRARSAAFMAHDSEYNFDIRRQTSRVVWLTGPGRKRQYLLALQTTHFAMDAAATIVVMRQFLELLAAPGSARSELHKRVNLNSFLSRQFPDAAEHTVSKLGRRDLAVRQLRLEQDTLDRFTNTLAMPLSGLTNDVFERQSKPCIVRHTWSTLDTACIMHACKTHGTTVTHLFHAASALVVSELEREHGSKGLNLNPGDLYRFVAHIPFKLPSDDPTVAREVALRMTMYPMVIDIPRSFRSAEDTVWEIARRCRTQQAAFFRSPNFLPVLERYLIHGHLAAFLGLDPKEKRPFFPAISSLGDLAPVLPTFVRYQGAPSQRGETTLPAVTAPSRNVRVADLSICTRTDLANMFCHLWTFGGALNIQMAHSSMAISAELAEQYFRRLVQRVSRMGIEMESGRL